MSDGYLPVIAHTHQTKERTPDSGRIRTIRTPWSRPSDQGRVVARFRVRLSRLSDNGEVVPASRRAGVGRSAWETRSPRTPNWRAVSGRNRFRRGRLVVAGPSIPRQSTVASPARRSLSTLPRPTSTSRPCAPERGRPRAQQRYYGDDGARRKREDTHQAKRPRSGSLRTPSDPTCRDTWSGLERSETECPT
jgi:hypothetical protein